VSIKTDIILNRRSLEVAAYVYSAEIGVSRTNIQKPSAEEINDMIEQGIVSADLTFLDKAFGYTCYEYYRQVYDPDSFDRLLLKEAENRKKIVDLCCGGGATIFSLRQNNPEMIFGFDSNENQIELLKSLNRDRELKDIQCKVIAKVADAHHLPIESGCVDFVVCRAALQYLNVEQALKEIYRVLVPQGKVFLLVHGSGYIFDYLFSRKGIFKTKYVEYFVHKLFHSSSSDNKFYRSQAHFLTTHHLETKLTDAGFRNIKLYTFKKWLKLGVFPVYFAVTAER
jgi:ubiquinone/menaquinone biosynthesis C-methylase UbiE